VKKATWFVHLTPFLLAIFPILSLAYENIEFVDSVSDKDLSRYYAGCKALIFPQHEDYGITPLEANASGRPVIAYGKGGVLETMVPLTSDPLKATAVFFAVTGVTLTASLFLSPHVVVMLASSLFLQSKSSATKALLTVAF